VAAGQATHTTEQSLAFISREEDVDHKRNSYWLTGIPSGNNGNLQKERK